MGLILIETVYLWACLPETHPRFTPVVGGKNGAAVSDENSSTVETNKKEKKDQPSATTGYTNNPALLNLVHLLFLLPFSGMEFSLPFLTTTLLAGNASKISPSAVNGRILGLVGLIASVLQGTTVRRLPPLATVRIGVVACAIAFFSLANISSLRGLQISACFLAIRSMKTAASTRSKHVGPISMTLPPPCLKTLLANVACACKQMRLPYPSQSFTAYIWM